MYETPESNLDVNDNSFEYQKLQDQQRPIWGALSCFGLVVGSYVILEYATGIVPMFVYLIPSIIGGLSVKFIGRPITELNRIIPAFIVALLTALVFSGKIGLYTIIMPLLGFGICYAISRRNLSYEQEKIIYKKRLGKKKS